RPPRGVQRSAAPRAWLAADVRPGARRVDGSVRRARDARAPRAQHSRARTRVHRRRRSPQPRGTCRDRAPARRGDRAARGGRVSTSHPLRGSIAGLASRVFVRERVLRGSTLRLGRVWIHGEGEVFVDEDVIFDARWAPIEIHAAKGARILLGRGARIDSGASLEALASITVGAGATLGAFCKVMDNHFHQIDRDHRVPPSRPVTIGAGAIVGERAILLPGASIANGASVPPGAVITRRFGASATAATNAATGTGADRLPIAQDRSYVPSRARMAKCVSAVAVLRAACYLRTCAVGRRVHAGGPVAVVNEGHIEIGANAVFVGGMIPTGLVCARAATLRIGAQTIFNYGVSVTAARAVTIGE